MFLTYQLFFTFGLPILLQGSGSASNILGNTNSTTNPEFHHICSTISIKKSQNISHINIKVEQPKCRDCSIEETNEDCNRTRIEKSIMLDGKNNYWRWCSEGINDNNVTDEYFNAVKNETKYFKFARKIPADNQEPMNTTNISCNENDGRMINTSGLTGYCVPFEEILISNASVQIKESECAKNESIISNITAQCVDEWCRSQAPINHIFTNNTFSVNKDLEYFHFTKLTLTFNITFEIVLGCNVALHFGKNYTSSPGAPNEVQNLTTYSRSDTTAWLKWKAPNPPTGELDRYFIENVNITGKINDTCIYPTYVCGEVSGLEPNESYNITVYAKNKGIDTKGKESVVIIPAEEGRSLPPENFNYSFNGSTCKLFWNHPNITNGPIKKFIITINNVTEINKTINFESSYYEEKIELEHDKTYNITIVAFNKFLGEAVHLTATAPPPIPQLKVEPLLYNCESVCIIKILPQPYTSHETYYYVINGHDTTTCSQVTGKNLSKIALEESKIKSDKEENVILNNYSCSFIDKLKGNFKNNDKINFLVILKVISKKTSFNCYTVPFNCNFSQDVKIYVGVGAALLLTVVPLFILGTYCCRRLGKVVLVNVDVSEKNLESELSGLTYTYIDSRVPETNLDDEATSHTYAYIDCGIPKTNLDDEATSRTYAYIDCGIPGTNLNDKATSHTYAYVDCGVSETNPHGDISSLTYAYTYKL